MEDLKTRDSNKDIDLLIDHFVKETQKLNGLEIREREAWNTTVTADSIKHFAYGIGDDNPLWLDKKYAKTTKYGKRLAPPAYLTSVLYPILHGAPVTVPLTNLIAEIDYTWHLPIVEGDRLTGRSTQRNAYDSRDKTGRRTVNIISDVSYWNQKGKILGTAKGTMVRAHLANDELLTNRKTYRYSPSELDVIKSLIESERSCLTQKISTCADLEVGMSLGEFVRGPLTIGDMVCWQAGAGPSYRGGALGYLDLLSAPHTKVINPVTGWPVKFSQQHEDYLMAADRGMPAPFDNGVMRFAQISSALTNFIGDDCMLNRLKIQVVSPNLYGDTTYYSVKIIDKIKAENRQILKVRITGKNQIHTVTTTGTADLQFPVEDNRTIDVHNKVQIASGNISLASTTSAHKLFEEQVLKHPEKTAVIHETSKFTFSQFNKLSNQFAHWLLEADIEPGSFVGIYLERGHMNVAAILAVLKAGSIYVPMDPEYTQERLLEMIFDTPLTAVITHKKYASFFPSPSTEKLFVESFITDSDAYKTTVPNIIITPDNLAYVMYTSGSVGRPKCVSVKHGGLISYVDALQKSLFKDKLDHIFLHTATTAFSASTRQTFLPLCTGSTMVIASENQRKDPIELFKLIKEKNVTIWDTVPSILHYYLKSIHGLSTERRNNLLPNSLIYLFSTGQAMSWAIPGIWYRDLDQAATIVNLYSQTETAGTVCAYHVPRDSLKSNGIVPIGHPLTDTPIYLLNEEKQKVKPGEKGEIIVGGNRISDGYLNHPELSQQCYVADPFSHNPQSIMFRTGDLAVQRADGTLEHTGRVDEKIKIRGIGVELGEIEKVLVDISGVEQGVVVAKGDAKGDYKLFAFVVTEQYISLDPAEIKRNLKEKLPSHMVPVAVEIIQKLPLGPNGKIDKSKLTVLQYTGSKYTHPTTPHSLVERLCQIWEEILDIPTVNPDDNFFDMGGNSLLVVEMADRIEKMLDSRIALTDLVEATTVSQLARLLEEGSDNGTPNPVVVLKNGGDKPPFFCVPGIGGNLMRHQALPKYLEDDQPFYGLQASGYEKNMQLYSSIETIASYYIQELRGIQPNGPYYICGTCFGGVVAFEIARQLEMSKEEVAMLVLVETRAPDRIIPHNMLFLERMEQLYGLIQALLIPKTKQKETNKRRDRLKSAAESKDTGPDKNSQPNLELKKTFRTARRNYKPKKIQGTIILYKVKESFYRRRLIDRRLPWKNVGSDFQEFWIPGNHLTMLEEPLVKFLGEQLSSHLKSAQSKYIHS